MASRESYAISNYWKYPRNNRNMIYPRAVNTFPVDKIRSVLFLFKRVLKGSKWERSMFVLDNITIPFNKKIGCRLRGKHIWFYMVDEERAFCTKCSKVTEYIPKNQWNRLEKLNKIKKRTK